jgi:MFS family permease
MGASVGFFVGPIYAGWRAETAGWRTPVLELGLLGVVAAGVFAWLADEESTGPEFIEPPAAHNGLFPTLSLWAFFFAAAALFSLRDFAGSSMGSLGSLFMQKAHGFTLRETGAALSAIFLAGVISNPLFGHLSDQGRIRWTAAVLLMSVVIVASFPRMAPEWLLPTLALYGFFFMASYPMVEAALMQSVPDAVRGRVFGLFITVGGLLGNLSHWIVGNWVKALGTGAVNPTAYRPLYLFLSLLLLASLLGLPCLHAIRKREHLDLDLEPVPGSAPSIAGSRSK